MRLRPGCVPSASCRRVSGCQRLAAELSNHTPWPRPPRWVCRPPGGAKAAPSRVASPSPSVSPSLSGEERRGAGLLREAASHTHASLSGPRAPTSRCPGPPLGTTQNPVWRTCPPRWLGPPRDVRVPNSPPSFGAVSGGFNVSCPRSGPPVCGAVARRSARAFAFLSRNPCLKLNCGPLLLRNPPPLGGGWRQTKNKTKKIVTTLSGGSLGSCVDEERS